MVKGTVTFNSSVLVEDKEINDDNYPCLIGTTGAFRDMLVFNIERFGKLSKCGWVKTPVEMGEFDVKLKSDKPVYEAPRKYYGKEKEVVVKQIKEWFDKGIIVRSKSEYGNKVALSTKVKVDGSVKYRFGDMLE